MVFNSTSNIAGAKASLNLFIHSLKYFTIVISDLKH